MAPTYAYLELLTPPPWWQRWMRVALVAVSIGIHIVAALLFLARPQQVSAGEQWIEMAVVQPPPPLAEPPPEKPRPKPQIPVKPVAFEDTVPADKAPPPETQTQRPVRRLGLSSTSFAPGSGTGMSVRAGNTTAVAPTDDLAGINDADGFDLRPVASVTIQPRGCSKPPVEVPKEAIANSIEGSIHMLLDLDAAGKVIRVRVQDRLGYGIEEACEQAARQVRCRPAMQDGTPVPVTGFPHTCTIKALD